MNTNMYPVVKRIKELIAEWYEFKELFKILKWGKDKVKISSYIVVTKKYCKMIYDYHSK